MGAVLIVVAGLMTWSFLEYAIHNWVGHLCKGRNEVSREHLRHHADSAYFAPWSKKLLLAGLILSAIWVGGTLLGATWAVNAYVSTIVTGWLGYEWLHRRLHTHAPRTALGRWARRHHLHHHFASPARNHGVSSPIWDHVFRTYDRPGLIRVPERQLHGVTWLVEPGAMSVKPEYAADYAIGAPRRAASAVPTAV
jgi:sterol desaturase/sphingolipid hydroxylase (fatty acid hydroxylase superfamily)